MGCAGCGSDAEQEQIQVKSSEGHEMGRGPLVRLMSHEAFSCFFMCLFIDLALLALLYINMHFAMACNGHDFPEKMLRSKNLFSLATGISGPTFASEHLRAACLSCFW